MLSYKKTIKAIWTIDTEPLPECFIDSNKFRSDFLERCIDSNKSALDLIEEWEERQFQEEQEEQEDRGIPVKKSKYRDQTKKYRNIDDDWVVSMNAQNQDF